LQRLQQGILFLDLVELQGMVGGDPVGRGGAAGRDRRPIKTPPLLILRGRCGRNNDGDKQSCRKNPKPSVVGNDGSIGRNVLLL
jgi:hypothetical protein